MTAKKSDKPAAVEASAPIPPAVPDPPKANEYPKWVKGRIFATRAEHESAGSSYHEVE